MAKIKTIDDCTSGKDILKLACKIAEKREDVEIKYCGSHPVVKVKGKGAMPIPCNHGSKQIGKGLMCALRKQWAGLGLVLAILLAILFGGRYPNYGRKFSPKLRWICDDCGNDFEKPSNKYAPSPGNGRPQKIGYKCPHCSSQKIRRNK